LYVRTTGTYTLYAGSKAYVNDVYAPEFGTTLDSWVVLTAGELPTKVMSLSRPVWNNGLTVIPTANNGVYNYVLSKVGSRPGDRDNTDKRIIDSVKTRSGQIINCVSADGSTRCQKNGRGWAPLAQNRRALSLPANPNTVASNGYTNLENWLHSMSNSLVGVTSASSPAAPATVSVR
jgi:hypothetical protein